MEDFRKKKGGVVNSLIVGTGGLIITVIIVFVIVSTMLNANMIRGDSHPQYVYNESNNLTGNGMVIDHFDTDNYDYQIIRIINASVGFNIPSSNWTFVSSTGNLTNATLDTYNHVNVTYRYYNKTTFEKSARDMGANFSGGINNVSTKLPTILLIGAMVLLFGIIVLLVRQSQAMQLGSMGGKGGKMGASLDGSSTGSL